MAISRIKGTYTLDAETVRVIETLAKRWGTSKSDVLRRAIRAAATGDGLEGAAAAALDQLQRRAGLTGAAAGRWAAAARDERRTR